MVVTDIFGVILVQAEAREAGWLAGLMDAAQWPVAIVTTTITVTALQGHSETEKVWVIGLVTCANVGGTKLGQLIGKRFVKDAKNLSLTDRVTALERVAVKKGPL